MLVAILFTILTLHVIIFIAIDRTLKLSGLLLKKLTEKSRAKRALKREKVEIAKREKEQVERNRQHEAQQLARQLGKSVEEIREIIG